MRLVIGCPVKDRAWIMDKWFDHIELAIPDEVEVEYVFVIPSGDETLEIINKRCPQAHLVLTEEAPSYERNWHKEGRYREMVQVRNALLREVRRINPDYFLSLDSDILVTPTCISESLSIIRDGYNAVAPPTFLDPTDKRFTNAAVLKPRGGYYRATPGTSHIVDIIMAIKLMDRAAYQVDYDFNIFGEDFGWSKGARENGIKMFYAGGIGPSKHVMKKEWLDRIDERCGF